MAHRLAFSSNRPVPIAMKVSDPGSGQVLPLPPADQLPRIDPRTHLPAPPGPPSPLTLAKGAAIELFAIDQTALDREDGTTEDVLWAHAAFDDPLGRRVRLEGRVAVPRNEAVQHFGGVAARALQPTDREPDEPGEPEQPGWTVVPLIAWGSYDVIVDGAVSDARVLGVLRLEERESPRLDLLLFPRVLDGEGRAHAAPLQAAEDLGVAGWRLHWPAVDYLQVPVHAARAERGDTLSAIAREMAVDADVLRRANPGVADPDAPLQGELVRVPFIVRAAAAAARRARSIALSWKEIIRGWTTLN
ncbi:MAG: hypothetical protein CW345_03155 [Firmicutes bacterium]|nr:hypothetical protein [Bacillota bacterium]MBO2520793.1 hypothetical protein [Bacillota bacterium]